MIAKKLREEANWTQEQLATMSGLSIRTIQRVESGRSASIETLKCLASVFEIEISKLTEEITVIDKESESWKMQPWWFRWSFWKIRSRRAQVKGEKFCLVVGIITWLLGLTLGIINLAGFDIGALFKALGLVYGSLMGPLFILTAYYTGAAIRRGDKEKLW